MGLLSSGCEKHVGSLRTYHTHLKSAIREPGVSTAVSPLADLVEPVDEVHLCEIASALQVGKKLGPLGIDIGGRMMRDLARGVAETHPLIENSRPNPHRTAVRIEFIRAPESHVVALSRIVADGLLEGQVLFTPPQEQIADRRVVVWMFKDGGIGDLKTAAQRQRGGRLPVGRQHDPLQVGCRTDQGHI
jgi:hypothetical protein